MSPARDQDYFCEGMAEEITNTLAQARGLRVIARTSAFRFKGQARDVREIGRALGATAVLEGSIRTGANRIRIAIQLVDTSGGYQIWSDRFDRNLDDVLAVQDDISRRVAESLSARLTAEATPPRAEIPSLETHDSQLRAAIAAAALARTPASYRLVAAEYWRVGVFDRSHEYLTAALAMAPQDAATFDALARLWRDAGFPQLGLADAHRAVYFAPESAAGRGAS
jgi:TolB-like protein